MTTTATSAHVRGRNALSDGLMVLYRDLLQIRHSPGELASNFVFPIILIVIFGFVFGSAIKVPGNGDYIDYLVPGLFVLSQVSSFSALTAAIVDDNATGIMDRLQAMPMARLAVPFGRTGADIITGLLSLIGMVACGAIAGWRFHHGLPDALAALGVLVVFRYGLAWLGAYLGMLITNPRLADGLAPLTLPICMISNAFVPTAGMPAWLRTIAQWNPVSCATQACRTLFGNPSASSEAGPLQHPIIATLAWAILLTAIFLPLAANRFARRGN